MTNANWIDLGGFLSVVAILLGLAVAFAIPGMEPAALIGTLPGICYCLAMHFHDWSTHV